MTGPREQEAAAPSLVDMATEVELVCLERRDALVALYRMVQSGRIPVEEYTRRRARHVVLLAARDELKNRAAAGRDDGAAS